MRLITLEVQNFGCVRDAKVELAPGLNVLFGPNDLGKSSLISAIRSVLLLPHASSASSGFSPWHDDTVPEVRLTLEEDRFYRVAKRFASGSRGSAVLETSKDGLSWAPEARSRQVDDELRKALRLGLSGPGGRGGSRSIHSFLTTLLLPTQSGVMDVFDKDYSLSNDPDESGYARLSDALSAMARDPVFAAILTRAQARVDEAFTATGRLKRSADAPLTQIRDELAEVENALAERQKDAERGDAIRERLQSLFAERAEARARHAEAEAAWASADRYQAAVTARDDARLVVVAQDRANDEIIAASRSGAELEKAVLSAAEVERQKEEALAVATASKESADRAWEKVRAEGEAGAERLRQSELAAKISELERDLEKVDQRHQEASSIVELGNNLKAVDVALANESASVEGQERSLETLRSDRDRRIEEVSTLELASQLLAIDEAKAASERVGQLSRDADAARERAKELEAASAKDLALSMSAPDERALDRAIAIDQELRDARAKASVGIQVTVRSDPAVGLETRVDGEAASSSSVGSDPRRFDGRREVRLTLDGQTEVHAEAGGEEQRTQLRALVEQFEAEVRPLLESTSVADVDGLRKAVASAASAAERAATQSAEAAKELQSADQIEAASKVAASVAADLPRLTAAVDGQSTEAARALLSDLPSPAARALEDRLRSARSAKDSAERGLGDATASMATARANLNAQQAEAVKARLVLEEKMAAVGGSDPQSVVEEAIARRAALAKEREAAISERDQVERQASEGQRAAEDASRAARAAVESAANEFADAGRLRVEAEKKAAEQRGRIERLREVDDPNARTLAAETLARCEQALAELSSPGPEFSKEVLRSLRSTADHAKAEVLEVEREIGRSEGALETAGGVVAKEEAARLRESKGRLQERQHDTELDYEAWRLLVETMTTVESEQSVHLGRSVMPKIEERFATLTNERYGGLVLGPNLEAEGVAAVGDTRSIGDLSIGTQEQLSTIFRLVLAEELGSAVLLDDQLTQTDPRRMRFFRERLRQAAAGIQVLVVTCHPEDYLGADEVPGPDDPVKDSGLVRAVDLERLVDRA